MSGTNYTNIREVQRNYKKVVEEVKKTHTPTIVMSKNEPQFAIVSLDMLERLREPEQNRSAQALLELSHLAMREGIKGPVDLSENHDAYTWDKR